MSRKRCRQGSEKEMSVIPEISVGDGQNGAAEDCASSSKSVLTFPADGSVSPSYIKTVHNPQDYV